jgi:penicillin-binding protein 1A
MTIASSLARWTLRIALGLFVVVLAAVMLATIAAVTMYARLPALDALAGYHAVVPMRIFTADGTLIGEFGEERRTVVKLSEVPPMVQHAVLAAEDGRFYEHGGVDYSSVIRAATANLRANGVHEGASTITMQVARAFFLSNERTFTRKIAEAMLAEKIEREFTKQQVLEIYMNQIYLGERAYGFAAASDVYFGVPMQRLSWAQAAMLAGLPKAPSSFNPIVNPDRARERRDYVLRRLHELGNIDDRLYAAALQEPIEVRPRRLAYPVEAEYAAEDARQLLLERYGEEAYRMGLRVVTTLHDKEQQAAVASVIAGVLAYDGRHGGYRGPERKIIPWPASAEDEATAAQDALDELVAVGNLEPAIVLQVEQLIATAQSREGVVKVSVPAVTPERTKGKGNAPTAESRVPPGSVIRIRHDEKGGWVLAQLPQVEAALVSMDPQSGAIVALAGGFDFARNHYNHATQAQRQPGSSFKPFVYSAALEKGFRTTTLLDDSPVEFVLPGTGGRRYSPHDYDDRYLGQMTLRTALMKSRNVPAVRVLRSIGIPYARAYVKRFGLTDAQVPPFLTMVLGVGTATPLQMARAYAVFANGGHLITPYLIDKVTDNDGRLLWQPARAPAGTTEPVIDPRNAFIMTSMLRDVIRAGTGVGARSLGRQDVGGKTGSTNNFVDAWFAGFTQARVAVSWIGFDAPRTLGKGEVGGHAALPIWTQYMATALEGRPQEPLPRPPGIVAIPADDPGHPLAMRPQQEYFYVENQPPVAAASAPDAPPNSGEDRD